MSSLSQQSEDVSGIPESGSQVDMTDQPDGLPSQHQSQSQGTQGEEHELLAHLDDIKPLTAIL